jgi:transposase-like protein
MESKKKYRSFTVQDKQEAVKKLKNVGGNLSLASPELGLEGKYAIRLLVK